MIACKSTAEEVSFEWSHHRISSTDLKARTPLHVSTIDSGINERVKRRGHTLMPLGLIEGMFVQNIQPFEELDSVYHILRV